MASHAERLKTNHAPIMRTLHGEIRRHPGGYVEIARETGRPVQTIINMFNPHNTDTAPPLDLFLDVVEIVRARGTLGLQASGMGLMLAPIPGDAADDAISDVEAFDQVVREAGDVLAVGSRAAADNIFDAGERVEMARELDELISKAVALRKRMG